MLVRIGSRGSRLALTQAEQAAARRRRRGVEVAFVPITTAGDLDRKRPFGEIGARGVFVKEIEEALLAGRIDVAVHSAKDMTSTDTEGLVVGASRGVSLQPARPQAAARRCYSSSSMAARAGGIEAHPSNASWNARLPRPFERARARRSRLAARPSA